MLVRTHLQLRARSALNDIAPGLSDESPVQHRVRSALLC